MFIEKIEQNTVKVNFYASEEEIYIGDLIKIGSSGQKGIIGQVVKIESPENNQDYNTATSKILFTVETSGKLTEWQGNAPGTGFIVDKVTPDEFLTITKTGNVENPVFSGQLSCYPEITVNLEAAFLETSSVIVADKESQKNEFLELFAVNLSEKNAKVVLIDYNGDFVEDEEVTVLKAGEDVKLPFDLKGIEVLYDKALSGVSSEIRAGIENIFSEIEDYLTSKKASFLPFKMFVDAVNTENQENKLPELDLLTNSLSKLHKKGVFADSQKEIINIFSSINDNNLVILDLSDIDREWKPFFVDSIIRLNKEKLKRKFFLLMDIDKYKDFDNQQSTDVAEKIFNYGIKSGIRPIVSVSHHSESLLPLYSEAENVFIFQPQSESMLTGFAPYLPRLGLSEVLVCGKVTNRVPLYIKLPVYDKQEDGFFNTGSLARETRLEFGSSAGPEKSVAKSPPVIEKQAEQAVESIEKTREVSDEPDRLEKHKPFPDHKNERGQVLEPAVQNLESTGENYEEHEEAAEDRLDEEPQSRDESSLDYAEAADDDEYYESEESEDENALDYVEESEDETEYASPAATPENNEEFSDNDLRDFMDYDENEDSGEHEAEDDEYYESEEFEDESALDYVEESEDETEYAYPAATPESNEEFSDNDLKGFMDYDENEDSDEHEAEDDEYYESEEFEDESALDYAGEAEDDEYYESEEFEDESALDYVEESEDETEYASPAATPENNEEFSDNDLRNFMDFDDDDEDFEEENNRVLPEHLGMEEEPAEEVSSAPVRKTSPKPRPRKMKPLKNETTDVPPTSNLPVYDVPGNDSGASPDDLREGDKVRHKKYGIGTIKKVIGYSEKRLCSIQFEDVGRRLLDPKIAELEKI